MVNYDDQVIAFSQSHQTRICHMSISFLTSHWCIGISFIYSDELFMTVYCSLVDKMLRSNLKLNFFLFDFFRYFIKYLSANVVQHWFNVAVNFFANQDYFADRSRFQQYFEKFFIEIRKLSSAPCVIDVKVASFNIC